MPYTAQEKDDQKIQIHPSSAPTVPAEWYINIRGKETVQRNMPPLPEIHDIDSLIRRIEVNGDFNTEHPPDSPCHIAVTAEIKIELERISEDDHKCIRLSEKRHVRITIIHACAERIRQNHLFEQPQHEQHIASGKFFPVEFLLRHSCKLWKHLALRHNRACDQLRKERDKQCIRQQPTIFYLSPVCIHEKANLLKSEKTDAEWQQYVTQ